MNFEKMGFSPEKWAREFVNLYRGEPLDSKHEPILIEWNKILIQKVRDHELEFYRSARELDRALEKYKDDLTEKKLDAAIKAVVFCAFVVIILSWFVIGFLRGVL